MRAISCVNAVDFFAVPGISAGQLSHKQPPKAASMDPFEGCAQQGLGFVMYQKITCLVEWSGMSSNRYSGVRCKSLALGGRGRMSLSPMNT